MCGGEQKFVHCSGGKNLKKKRHLRRTRHSRGDNIKNNSE
jgi:hypothetical protein